MAKSARVIHGSGNVFKDIGLPDAEELAFKADIVIKLAKLIEMKGLTQSKAAASFFADISQASPWTVWFRRSLRLAQTWKSASRNQRASVAVAHGSRPKRWRKLEHGILPGDYAFQLGIAPSARNW
jgi:hypothetical protein